MVIVFYDIMNNEYRKTSYWVQNSESLNKKIDMIEESGMRWGFLNRGSVAAAAG